MSSNTMLKQAIIDANALRDVALKNAEAIVVEKYSNQIKEAVDLMLEQEEEEDLGMETGLEDPMGMPPAEGGLPSSRAAMAPEDELVSAIDDQVTLGAVDGDRLCPCPEDKEILDFDMNDLQAAMLAIDRAEEESTGFDAAAEPPMPQPTPGEMLPSEEGEEELPFAIAEGVDENIMLELDDLLGEDLIGNAPTVTADEGASTAGEGDAAFGGNVNAGDSAIAEDEDVGVAGGENPSEIVQELAESLQKKNKKVLKENTKLAKTNSKMLTEQKQLLKEQQQLLKENKEIKNLLRKLSGTLGEVNLSNAKLIYTNRVLSNGASLNERQKQRIVEAINSADSVEAAKSTFETLQSAVGSSLKSGNKSQSLGEAINRGNATTLRQKQKQTRQDPHLERMKKLAGI